MYRRFLSCIGCLDATSQSAESTDTSNEMAQVRLYERLALGLQYTFAAQIVGGELEEDSHSTIEKAVSLPNEIMAHILWLTKDEQLQSLITSTMATNKRFKSYYLMHVTEAIKEICAIYSISPTITDKTEIGRLAIRYLAYKPKEMLDVSVLQGLSAMIVNSNYLHEAERHSSFDGFLSLQPYFDRRSISYINKHYIRFHNEGPLYNPSRGERFEVACCNAILFGDCGCYHKDIILFFGRSLVLLTHIMGIALQISSILQVIIPQSPVFMWWQPFSDDRHFYSAPLFYLTPIEAFIAITCLSYLVSFCCPKGSGCADCPPEFVPVTLNFSLAVVLGLSTLSLALPQSGATGSLSLATASLLNKEKYANNQYDFDSNTTHWYTTVNTIILGFYLLFWVLFIFYMLAPRIIYPCETMDWCSGLIKYKKLLSHWDKSSSPGFPKKDIIDELNLSGLDDVVIDIASDDEGSDLTGMSPYDYHSMTSRIGLYPSSIDSSYGAINYSRDVDEGYVSKHKRR